MNNSVAEDQRLSGRLSEPDQSWYPADVDPQQVGRQAPAYYDVPMLKRSPWKWEISSYFFFGGLSSAAYLIARLADRFGGRKMAPLTNWGTKIAAISLLPCPPLLIKDLGHMKRFHHMLRVIKPETPMSVGTWTLVSYSGVAAVTLLRELLRHDEIQPPARRQLKELIDRNDSKLMAVLDCEGIPAALLMMSYTGVLVSCTATPIWTRNHWLSPLFVASAVNTGAAAIQLALACCAEDKELNPSSQVLQKISLAAKTAEAITLIGYLKSLNELAKPLIRGRDSISIWVAVASLIAPELISHLLPGKSQRWKLTVNAAITLLGGLSLRHGIVKAGNRSAQDPQAARAVSR
jgi:formate-dependent nitrite reductase membrane component NrfD